MVRKAEAGSPSAFAHTCDAERLPGDCGYSACSGNLGKEHEKAVLGLVFEPMPLAHRSEGGTPSGPPAGRRRYN